MAQLTRLTKTRLGKLAEPLSELGLEVRNCNAMEERGLFTVEDALNSCPRHERECQQHCLCRANTPGLAPDWQPKCYLLDIPNFGRVATTELFAKLAAIGFESAGEPDGRK